MSFNISYIHLKNTCPVVENIILACMAFITRSDLDLLLRLSFLFPKYSHTFSNLDKPMIKTKKIQGSRYAGCIITSEEVVKSSKALWHSMLIVTSHGNVYISFRHPHGGMKCKHYHGLRWWSMLSCYHCSRSRSF